ncbi:hypothetical protein DSO57_1018400 [Entomophthora muscae]|uniref:Uncharacterized protein n=1 Tax=Entomophthora muscae TaxID=34485 RepID=A0ACC2U2M6_9FUNG|nr:hypothetical protein DSO57_1018400 [Entomophthora muscae]
MLSALFQFAADSLTMPWPALYPLVPLALSSDLPLQLMFLILVLMSAISYTHKGAKLVAPSHQFGLVTQTEASVKTGLGELGAPKGIVAPSPNAIIGLGAPNTTMDQIFWFLKHICYQADLLQNATSRSASTMIPVSSALNPTDCTEVPVNNLAATEDADNAANKLAVHSTSVKLQDLYMPVGCKQFKINHQSTNNGPNPEE